MSRLGKLVAAIRKVRRWRYRNSETGKFIDRADYDRFPKAVTEREEVDD